MVPLDLQGARLRRGIAGTRMIRQRSALSAVSRELGSIEKARDGAYMSVMQHAAVRREAFVTDLFCLKECGLRGGARKRTTLGAAYSRSLTNKSKVGSAQL